MPTCMRVRGQNKILKIFIFAHMASFRIMRKFAPFEIFPLYGTTYVHQVRGARKVPHIEN